MPVHALSGILFLVLGGTLATLNPDSFGELFRQVSFKKISFKKFLMP